MNLKAQELVERVRTISSARQPTASTGVPGRPGGPAYLLVVLYLKLEVRRAWLRSLQSNDTFTIHEMIFYE